MLAREAGESTGFFHKATVLTFCTFCLPEHSHDRKNLTRGKETG